MRLNLYLEQKKALIEMTLQETTILVMKQFRII